MGQPLQYSEYSFGSAAITLPQDSRAWSVPHPFASMSRDCIRKLESVHEWREEGLEGGNR